MTTNIYDVLRNAPQDFEPQQPKHGDWKNRLDKSMLRFSNYVNELSEQLSSIAKELEKIRQHEKLKLLEKQVLARKIVTKFSQSESNWFPLCSTLCVLLFQFFVF